MTAACDRIALTDEQASLGSSDFDSFGDGTSITTEVASPTVPADEWMQSIDAILGVLRQLLAEPASTRNENPNSPNRASIESALRWMRFLRRSSLARLPPTCILPEPGGGVIIEHRNEKRQCVWELTLYNTGTGEFTMYQNGKVKDIIEVPMSPPSRHN